MKKLFFLIFSVFFIIVEVEAFDDMPDESIGKPIIFDSPEGQANSYLWEDKAKARDWGDVFTYNAWKVYVADADVVSYYSPSETSRFLLHLDFMESFYVAKVSGDYALLFYSSDKLYGREIPYQCRNTPACMIDGHRKDGYVGWVKVDDLLLWNICPRNKYGIYKKVAVVKELRKITEENAKKIPTLYEDKECKKRPRKNGNLTEFDFCFLFKKSGGNALVLNGNYTLPLLIKEDIQIGWLDDKEFIDWDKRVCWEVCFGEERDDVVLNDNAITFKDIEAAFNCDVSKSMSEFKINEKRIDPKFPRCPVLKYDKDKRVATLAVIGNVGNGVSFEKRLEIQKKIKEREEALSKINVFFVMDATKSMKPYFEEISKAIKQIAKKEISDVYPIKYGVVAYRNYKDEIKGALDSVLDLTSNTDKVARFLEDVKCDSEEKFVAEEAMFHGLDVAADKFSKKKNESNFIILVTDVGSKEPDAKGKTTDYISNKFKENNINFIAYQPAYDAAKASGNFQSQVLKIMSNVLKNNKYNCSITENNNIIEFVQDTINGKEMKWPLRPMACRYAEYGTTKTKNELYNFAVKTLQDFIDKTVENIMELKIASSGSNGEGIINVCDRLIEEGVIKKCEDLKCLVKVDGYAKRSFCSEKQMFTPCVFLADKELSDLIIELKKATANTFPLQEQKKILQKVCLSLIFSYTGQKYSQDDIDNIERLDKIIMSIEDECGYSFDDNVKDLIINPSDLRKSDVEYIVNELNVAIQELESVQEDSHSYLMQNNHRYYYILLSQMPFVEKY